MKSYLLFLGSSALHGLVPHCNTLPYFSPLFHSLSTLHPNHANFQVVLPPSFPSDFAPAFLSTWKAEMIHNMKSHQLLQVEVWYSKTQKQKQYKQNPLLKTNGCIQKKNGEEKCKCLYNCPFYISVSPQTVSSWAESKSWSPLNLWNSINVCLHMFITDWVNLKGE